MQNQHDIKRILGSRGISGRDNNNGAVSMMEPVVDIMEEIGEYHADVNPLNIYLFYLFIYIDTNNSGLKVPGHY